MMGETLRTSVTHENKQFSLYNALLEMKGKGARSRIALSAEKHLKFLQEVNVVCVALAGWSTTPVLYGREVRHHVNVIFPGQWIGRGGPVA